MNHPMGITLVLPFTEPIGDDQTKTLAFDCPIMNRSSVFPAVA